MKQITRDQAVEMISKGKVMQAERKALGHEVTWLFDHGIICGEADFGKDVSWTVFTEKI